MTNIDSQRAVPAGRRGFTLPIVIAIVALVLVVAGVGYFATRKQPQTNPTTPAPTGEKTLPDGTMVKPDGTMIKPDGMMIKTDGTMMGRPVTVTLDSLNNSGERGTAVLSDMDGKTKVVVSISGAPAGTPQPAHIHMGSCPNPGAVKYPLTNLTKGVSETVLNVPISKILGELPLAVNVHKSVADAKTYVSCGNIHAEAMMKKEDGAMMAKYTGTVLAGKSAPLIDYNKADYDAAVKSDKLVALYFVANWCPICKVELPKLYAAFNDLTTDKVIGFQVNYNDSDTDANEKALASQFGVAYQHTKVFLKNGQRILKSPESWSKEQHLSEINKALAQ